MAISTDNDKLAVMEMGDVWEPALPLSPGASFSQGQKQQLIWGYSGTAWVRGFSVDVELSGDFVPPDYLPAPVYDIVLRSPFGEFMATLNGFTAVEYARRVNQVGNLRIELPVRDNLYRRIARDSIIEVWRKHAGGGATLEGQTPWFVRYKRRTIGVGGEQTIELKAKDSISMLDRRIVAYPAGSPQASKSGAADDLIKDAVYENLLDGASGSLRDRSAYISIEENSGLGANVSKAFAYRKLLEVLGALADLSLKNGTYLAFDLVYLDTLALRFKTFINQRGVDRRWTAPSPVILSAEQGSLANVEQEEDWRDEPTVAYAGGQGIEEDRTIATAINSSLISASPFGRSEVFRNATHLSNADTLQDEAQTTLEELAALNGFTAQLNDVPSARFGVDFDFGDYVSALIDGVVYDVRLEAFSRRLSDGADRLSVALELGGNG